MPRVETLTLVFCWKSGWALVCPPPLMRSHRLSSCAFKEFELSSTLVLVWHQTLLHSHWLSYALKEFELSSTLALVWPQTLMHSHWLSYSLKEFELSSTLALVLPQTLTRSDFRSRVLSKSSNPDLAYLRRPSLSSGSMRSKNFSISRKPRPVIAFIVWRSVPLVVKRWQT